MTNSQLILNWLADKKVSSSVIGAIALYATARYVGSSGTMSLPRVLGGSEVPVWLVGGVLGLGTNFIVDSVSDIALRHIPGNEKYRHAESIVLHLLVAGASFAFVPKILYMLSNEQRMNNNRLMMFAGAGVLAEGISQILTEYFNKNQVEADSSVVEKTF